MSKTQPLLDFYAAILDSMNIVDVSDGRLSLKVPNVNDEYSETPCLINGKRVVLPTDVILRSGSLEGMIAFHPLSENMLRGESEIVKFLRKMIRFRLASVSSQLLIELMSIAADPERHEDLSPRQAAYLQHVPNANEKTVKALSKLLNSHFDDLLNIYLKRSGTRSHENYRRVASVSFPIWDELVSPGTKVYDVDCGSVKNKKTIAALFEYVFPDPDDLDSWSEGSNNGVAPYFHALMKCYVNIARHLAKLVYKYRKYLDHPDLQRNNLEWEEDLDNLERWKTLIPPLPGNEGAVAKGEKEKVDTPTKTAKSTGFRPDFQAAAQQTTTEAPETDVPPWEEQPSTTVPQVTTTAPAGATTPTPVETGHGLNWRSVMEHRPTQAAAPVAYGQPVQCHTTFQVGGSAQPQQRPWGTPAYSGPYQQPSWQPSGGGHWGGGSSL